MTSDDQKQTAEGMLRAAISWLENPSTTTSRQGLANTIRHFLDERAVIGPPFVIVESPYRGRGDTTEEREADLRENVEYARMCVMDSLRRGEYPFASHLFYTQEGLLDDTVPEQRDQGIAAGLAWARKADLVAIYVDRGWTSGMMHAKNRHAAEGRLVEERRLHPERHLCSPACADEVTCVLCGRGKKPRGRDVALAAGNSYCDYECRGYMLEPRAGHLWPSELAQVMADQAKWKR